jgi:Tol biopolymer transport system component
MTDLKTLVEQEMDRASTPSYGLGDVAIRRDRKYRNRRVAGGVVGGAIGIVLIAAVIQVTNDKGATMRPANTPSPTSSPTIETAIPPGVVLPPGVTADAAGADAGLDYLVDLDTGATTPLPESIRGGLEGNGYAVSPDGAEVAYLGAADDGSEQVFVARLDGTRVRQITDEPGPHADPAWSPDGTKLAYVQHGNVFVIDLNNGRTIQVTFEPTQHTGVSTPQFTPDGASIVYTVDRAGNSDVLIVPATGGEVSFGGEVSLLAGGDGMDAQDGTLAPDGLQLAYQCSAGEPDASLCLANADGSNAKVLVRGWSGKNVLDPSWSPDGTRLAYWVFHAWDVYVIDVATGETTIVAKGAFPTWLDDHTLIVEPYTGPR